MKSQIIIVGGGILGLAHAYHLLEAGQQVTLLEKNNPLQGSSVRNFGQIVPSGFSAQWQKYGIKSVALYQKIHEEWDLKLRKEGSLYVASNEEELTLLYELNQINAENNYPSIMLSSAECIKRTPGLKEEYVAGGLYFDNEWVADPVNTVHRLTQYLIERKGLNYLPACHVYNYQNSSGHILVNSNLGQYQCEQLLFCPGHDLENAPMGGNQMNELLSVKLQMLEIKPTNRLNLKGSLLTGRTIKRYESFKECPSYQRIVSNQDTNDECLQLGIHLLFKETHDGNLIVGDSHQYAPYTEKDSLYPYITDQHINELLLGEMHKILDIGGYKIVKTWNGLYTQQATGDICSIQVDENIYVITAIGGKGMTASLGWAQENVKQIFNII